MRRAAVVLLSLMLPLASFAGVARADVPPPSDYVEQCTPEIQCQGGRVCGTYHGEANQECATAAKAAGMEQRCTSWGATVGSAVFCPIGAPRAEPPKAAAKKGCAGCATARESSSGAGALVSALGLTAVLVRRARRRRAAAGS